MVAFQTPPAWASRAAVVRIFRVLWSATGIFTAIWLIYAELYRLDAICLWCTAVHVVAFLLFGVTAFGTAATAYDSEPQDDDVVLEDEPATP
jgi:uncharacterized membrane protein